MTVSNGLEPKTPFASPKLPPDCNVRHAPPQSGTGVLVLRTAVCQQTLLALAQTRHILNTEQIQTIILTRKELPYNELTTGENQNAPYVVFIFLYGCKATLVTMLLLFAVAARGLYCDITLFKIPLPTTGVGGG